MRVQVRRKYDPDFKRNAVLLSEELGKTVAEIADNLGISRDLLYCGIQYSSRHASCRNDKRYFIEHGVPSEGYSLNLYCTVF